MPSHLISEAEDFIREHFKQHILPKYVYHNYEHTLDIVRECDLIGKELGLPEEELEILHLAALFHDAGYTGDGIGHEATSQDIFKDWIRNRDFSTEKVKMVLGCIRSTKIPQTPHNLAEQVMCDADLAYLGQDTFMYRSNLLRNEWKVTRNQTFDDREWYEIQVRFLESHVFHTSYAKQHYESGKEKNLSEVHRILAELKEKQA